jgi:murein L,D-transpeptidase YcbB/YkuD
VLDAKGHLIDPARIDWSPGAPFPYQVRQRPGPTNALGRIKFIFPNPQFVFLHDTPSKALFDRADRTFSSGCIRVERPFELAEILLRGKPGWDADALAAAVAEGKTRTVFLERPVPVLLLYLTVVAFDGGRDFAFYRDVYGRDKVIADALGGAFVYVAPEGLRDLDP